MKVKVEDGCISCGTCEGICPEVFQLGDDGFSHVVKQPDADMESAVQEAVDSCPVSVIVAE